MSSTRNRLMILASRIKAICRC